MQMGFQTRLMLGTTLLAVVFVGTSAMALAQLVDGFSDQLVAREYDEARRRFDAQMRLIKGALQTEASELSRSPRLLATAAIPEVDEVTFADVLAELPSPLIAVLDTKGRVLAGRRSWPHGEDLSQMAGYGEHLETGAATTQTWRHPSGLALVGIAPLVQGGELFGSLICGQLIDDEFAAQLGSVAGRNVLMLHEGQRLGGLWQSGYPSSPELAELLGLRHADMSAHGTPMSVVVAEQEHTGIALPLDEHHGIVFLAHDFSAVIALRDNMRSLLCLIGGVLIAAGLVLSKRAATRLSRPLRQLTAAADELRAGKLDTRVGDLGADRELQTLAQSFDAMSETMQSLVVDVRDKAARAEAANRAKDGFLTSMSHELRTPLTGIQSVAELLKEYGDEASAEERADFLGTILGESERLARRITDSLEYAAMAGDTAQWTLGKVDLAEACREAWRRVEGLSDIKSVNMQLSGRDDARLRGDRERIVQALEHLLHNAWKWSPADGQIDVRIEAEANDFHIAIMDCGPGLSVDQHAHVFGRFNQGGDVLVDKPDGIGLGLQIALEVAQMHGGTIDYCDREDGAAGGACFRMQLATSDRPIDSYRPFVGGAESEALYQVTRATGAE